MVFGSVRSKLESLLRGNPPSFLLSDELLIKLGKAAQQQVTDELDRLVPKPNDDRSTQLSEFERQSGLAIVAESLRILQNNSKPILLRRASQAELDRASISSTDQDSVSMFFRAVDGSVAAYYFYETLGYRFTVLMVSTKEEKLSLKNGLVLDFRQALSLDTVQDTVVSLQSADKIRLTALI